MGLRTALIRYLNRFDSRIVTFSITLVLLTFCLMVSLQASSATTG
jgi:hypothetical protein